MDENVAVRRIYRYDNLKFLLILLVILGHFAEPYVKDSHMMKSLFIFIYAFHMPLFVFCTGLFSRRVVNFPKFRGERIYSYLILFVGYKILLYITKLLCGMKPEFYLLTESGVPWFLLSCAEFLLVALIVKKWNRRMVFLLSIACACAAGYFPEIGDFLCLSRTIAYLPFFLLGYYAGTEKTEELLNSKLSIVSAGILFAFTAACWFCTDQVYLLRPLFTGRNPFSKLSWPQWGACYRFLYYIGILCLFPGIMKLASNSEHFFTKWGSRTLQIYILHRPLLYLYNPKFKCNTYLADIFPSTWKILYLMAGIGITVLLAAECLSPPFQAVMNWKWHLPIMKGGEPFPVKARLLRAFPLAAAFAYTVCVFGPLDIYSSNAEELWFGLKDVCLTSGALFLLILLCILALTLCVNGNTFLNFCTLLFGLTIAVYLQGTFLNIDYGNGILDGADIAWGEYERYALINCAVWLMCTAIPFAIRSKCSGCLKGFSFVAAALILMQTSALAVSLLHTGAKASGAFTVTTDGIYTLSGENNIIVMTLDTMSAQYFDEYLERHPKAQETFQGFTYFDNTTATGARTIMALPAMLTGIPFREQSSYSDYVETIWDGGTPLDALSELGYDVRVFTDAMYYGSRAADCIENFSTDRQKVGSYKVLAKKFGKLSAYRYAPHALKKLFWFNTSEFDAAKTGNIYSAGDAKFYNNFKKDGFKVTDQYTDAFRFYLLDGAHQPYTLTEKATRDRSGTIRDEQVDGVFYLVNQMLDNLRKLGLYDKATIVITADHGDKNYAQDAVLLCKLPGGSGDLKVSHAPVSLFDFPSTLVEWAGGDGDAYGSGLNFLELNETDTRIRRFYLNTEVDSKPCVQEIVIPGDARDIESMYIENEYFVNGGRIEP